MFRAVSSLLRSPPLTRREPLAHRGWADITQTWSKVVRGLRASATIRALDDFFPQTDNPVEEGERSGKALYMYTLHHAPPPPTQVGLGWPESYDTRAVTTYTNYGEFDCVHHCTTCMCVCVCVCRYVLLKERNMLLTVKQEANRSLFIMPGPERIRKVWLVVRECIAYLIP